MSSYTPLYRLTIRSPRSVDATEATTLTPAAGAPHSDPFVVATMQGVSGAKGYLGLPSGRQGSIDVLTKKATVGVLNLPLFDFRTATDNAHRWVTAFLGNASGKLQLKGCKAILEETLDGNPANLAPIFTGRGGDLSLDAKQRFTLEVRSIADDMRKSIFVGRPHSSITYAFRPALFPIGLPQSWANGAFPARARIKGTVNAHPQLSGAKALIVDAGQDPTLTQITRQSWAAVNTGGVVCYAMVTNGGSTGLFKVTQAFGIQNNFGSSKAPQWQALVFGPISVVDAADPLFMAMPADGTAVTFYIFDDVPVSPNRPLLIDNVHPVQLWADILDGKFSTLINYANRAIAGRDTTAFSNLISDTSFGTMRVPVTAPSACNDWIERYICQPNNLAYGFDGQGRVVPRDLRPDSVSVLGSIGDTDLATTDTPRWRTDGSRAVFAAKITYYADQPIQPTDLSKAGEFPDVPLTLLQSTQNSDIVINPDASPQDAGDQLVEVDAIGIRLAPLEVPSVPGAAQPTLLAVDKLRRLTARMLDLLPPFAGGAATLPLRVRRSATAASLTAGVGCFPGTYWSLTISTEPDPATNLRGGTRLGLCTSRTENGSFVDFEFLDVGANVTAAIPAIGTLALAGGGIDVPITLNVNGEVVRVEYALTPAGTGSRPGASDPAWRFLDTYTASATKNTGAIATGVRAWVRARTQVLGRGLKMPSAWVFPAGGSPAGSIDFTAITAPSALATSGLLGNRVTVSWTVGDASKPIDVYLATGGVPGTWTEAMRVSPQLAPGSTRQRFVDLTPSTQYTVGVRHADAFGGVSAMATITFTTTGTRAIAILPPRLGVGGGGTSGIGASLSSPSPRGAGRTGVALLLYAADPAYGFEIQEAPDSAGTPNVGAAVTVADGVSGRQGVYVRATPLDGAQRWYRHRHVGFGDTPSAWTDFVAATPVIQPIQGPADSTTTPLNAQERFRCKLRLTAGVTLVSGTPQNILWDVEDVDVGGLHDTSSNKERVTIPVGGDKGFWIFTASFDLLSNATAGLRTIRIRWSNGSLIVAEAVLNTATEWESQISVIMDSVPVGDYFWVEALQASGVNQTFNGGGQIGNLQAIHVW